MALPTTTDAIGIDVDGGDFGTRFRQMSGRLRPEPGCRAGDHNRALPQIHSFVSEMCVGAFGPLDHNLSIGETGEHSIKSTSLAQSGATATKVLMISSLGSSHG